MVPVTVIDGENETVIQVQRGKRLRDALLANGFTPYGSVSKRLNCGGRGLCGTCGVAIAAEPEPIHWHDAAAERFGYPRLSCRIEVTEPMTVELLEKRVWGQLIPETD